MYFSKYNIFSKIQDSDSSYIVNLLTGNADILTPDIAAEVAKGNYPDRDEFIAKGYLIDEKEERRLYNEKYLDHLDEKAKDEDGEKVGRNDLCPCGSGKKYKACHGKGLN